jgi:hypothetical protein
MVANNVDCAVVALTFMIDILLFDIVHCREILFEHL